MMNFNATLQEINLIAKVCERARFSGMQRDTLAMDLEACHSNGCPLDFEVLLNFNAFDFWHDLHGIWGAIDRTTGKLGNQFIPRSAQIYHSRSAA